MSVSMISVFGVSDKGAVRTNNQDTVAYKIMENENSWGVVCDGMGGIQGGDIASQIAVETFGDYLTQYLQGNEKAPIKALLHAVEKANKAVFEYALKDESLLGMGTTLVGTVLQDGVAYIVNIGDSRAYTISHNNILRITRDHSIVQDLVEEGNITDEQARSHPQKNLITRALGTSKMVEADIFQVEFRQGDWLLLCSDGLVNELTEKEILLNLKGKHNPKESCQQLLNIALERGATDNVTVLLFGTLEKK